jgi:hypothetical protein
VILVEGDDMAKKARAEKGEGGGKLSAKKLRQANGEVTAGRGEERCR